MSRDAILITGITGQLGMALSKRLNERKERVVCFIRKPRNEYPRDFGGLELLEADLTDRRAVFAYAKQLKDRIGTVVHMAGLPDGHPRKVLRENIYEASISMYEFANEIGCPKFIYLSSILAAGPVPHDRAFIDEGFDPPSSRLCYFGKMKLKTEKKLKELSDHSMTKTVMIRPGNIYGQPKLSFIKFVSRLIMKRNRVFYQRAKRSAMWSPVHTQDVIDCIFRLLDESAFDGKTYFLTAGRKVTLEEVTGIICDALGVPLADMEELTSFEKGHLALRKAIDFCRGLSGRPSFPDYVYSNDSIRRDLGFLPKVGLRDGIIETVDWAKNEGLLS